MIKNERKLQIEFRFERLANRKISQVYHLLVPLLAHNNICFLEIPGGFETFIDNNDNKNKGGKLNEDSSNLCPSLI